VLYRTTPQSGNDPAYPLAARQVGTQPEDSSTTADWRRQTIVAVLLEKYEMGWLSGVSMRAQSGLSKTTHDLALQKSDLRLATVESAVLSAVLQRSGWQICASIKLCRRHR
jgi:hypothetical protein